MPGSFLSSVIINSSGVMTEVLDAAPLLYYLGMNSAPGCLLDLREVIQSCSTPSLHLNMAMIIALAVRLLGQLSRQPRHGSPEYMILKC